MKNAFIVTLFIYFLFACNKKKNNDSLFNSNDKVIATINNEPIFYETIEKLASKDLYIIRKKFLNKLIEDKIIENEAKKRNLSIDELLEIEITGKTEPANLDDFEKFRQLNPYINTFDISKLEEIKKIIESAKRSERRKIYIDSLIKNKYKVNILLEEPISRINNISALSQYYKGNKGARHSLYLIADYNCCVCKKIKPEIEKIVDKYKNRIKLCYIYYSDKINLGGITLEAAGKQGKFQEMLSLLYNEDFIDNDTMFYLAAANKIDIDTIQFKQDLKSEDIYKKISNNFYFLKNHEIYSVPRFVFDDILFPDTIKLKQLELFIKNNINK